MPSLVEFHTAKQQFTQLRSTLERRLTSIENRPVKSVMYGGHVPEMAQAELSRVAECLSAVIRELRELEESCSYRASMLPKYEKMIQEYYSDLAAYNRELDNYYFELYRYQDGEIDTKPYAPTAPTAPTGIPDWVDGW